jgi:hypothetical protein
MAVRIAVLSAVLWTVAPAALAAARYEPVLMAGEWEHRAEPTHYTREMGIRIDEEKTDGAFSGSLSYWGFHCNARDAR